MRYQRYRLLFINKYRLIENRNKLSRKNRTIRNPKRLIKRTLNLIKVSPRRKTLNSRMLLSKRERNFQLWWFNRKNFLKLRCSTSKQSIYGALPSPSLRLLPTREIFWMLLILRTIFNHWEIVCWINLYKDKA